MCKYCGNEHKNHWLLTKEIAWTGFSNIVQGYDDWNIFVDDRGYLRLVDDDNACLDHGESIKINFCPMCGKQL